jgi:hypothetical protein
MSKITVDLNHDIVFRLNGYDLLVSKVLCLASPAFEVMFKPHFKEGVEQHLQLGEPLIIPLPEDENSQSILILSSRTLSSTRSVI